MRWPKHIFTEREGRNIHTHATPGKIIVQKHPNDATGIRVASDLDHIPISTQSKKIEIVIMVTCIMICESACTASIFFAMSWRR